MKKQTSRKRGAKTGVASQAGGSAPLDLIEALRDQAKKDAESAARARDYSAAANWQAWSVAYEHLLVTVRSQSLPNAVLALRALKPQPRKRARGPQNDPRDPRGEKQ
jgi:hypothetical protein